MDEDVDVDVDEDVEEVDLEEDVEDVDAEEDADKYNQVSRWMKMLKMLMLRKILMT